MAKREMSKREAVRMCADMALAKILSLPIGTEISMYEVMKQCLGDMGYVLVDMDNVGHAFSNDGGKTYLVEEMELADLLLRVERRLRGERILDSSKYAGAVVGLPQNIPFIILESPGMDLVSVNICGGRDFNETEITVYDGPENNVTLLQFSWEGAEDTVNEHLTLPTDTISEIRKMAKSRILLKKQEEEPIPEIIVEDGNMSNITVYGGRVDRVLSYLNPWAYEDLDGYPQTKLAIELAKYVLKAVSKVSGKKLSLKTYS